MVKSKLYLDSITMNQSFCKNWAIGRKIIFYFVWIRELKFSLKYGLNKNHSLVFVAEHVVHNFIMILIENKYLLVDVKTSILFQRTSKHIADVFPMTNLFYGINRIFPCIQRNVTQTHTHKHMHTWKDVHLIKVFIFSQWVKRISSRFLMCNCLQSKTFFWSLASLLHIMMEVAI